MIGFQTTTAARGGEQVDRVGYVRARTLEPSAKETRQPRRKSLLIAQTMRSSLSGFGAEILAYKKSAKDNFGNIWTPAYDI